MQTSYDLAVVGAGAAGLMAAIFAGRRGKRVVAFDAAPRIGAKILISGGGRCNVTHDVVRAQDFNGNRNAIAKVLRAFDVARTVAFFEELGVPLKREETGKLFPVSDRARDVVDALLRAAREAGVEIRTGVRVSVIQSEAKDPLTGGGSFAVCAAQDDTLHSYRNASAGGTRDASHPGYMPHSSVIA